MTLQEAIEECDGLLWSMEAEAGNGENYAKTDLDILALRIIIAFARKTCDNTSDVMTPTVEMR